MKPGDRVGLDVPERGAHVDRARNRRGGCVDAEDLGAYRSSVEGVDVLGGPERIPFRLETVERRLLRYGGRHSWERLSGLRSGPCQDSDRAEVAGRGG